MTANVFIIGMVIIAAITITLFIIFPLHMIVTISIMGAIAMVFAYVSGRLAKDAPKHDQDFNVKFRRDDK